MVFVVFIECVVLLKQRAKNTSTYVGYKVYEGKSSASRL
jgi:hypothetical protein